jgi:hypothetical protein
LVFLRSPVLDDQLTLESAASFEKNLVSALQRHAVHPGKALPSLLRAETIVPVSTVCRVEIVAGSIGADRLESSNRADVVQSFLTFRIIFSFFFIGARLFFWEGVPIPSVLILQNHFDRGLLTVSLPPRLDDKHTEVGFRCLQVGE